MLALARSMSKQLTVFYVSGGTAENQLFDLRGSLLASAISALGLDVAIVFSERENQIVLRQIVGGQCKRSVFVHFADLLSELARLEGPQNTFVSCSCPNVDVFGAIQRLKSSGWRTVYDMDYDLEDMYRLKLISSYHFEVESVIANMVDRVTASNARLIEKAAAFGVNQDHLVHIPNSNLDGLPRLAINDIKRKVRRARAQNIVGYIGSLDPAWFDWSLILSTVNRLPGVDFQFVGCGAPQKIRIPDNLKVQNLGNITCDYHAIMRDWKIGVIAWNENLASLSVDPPILHSCLWAGIPVVTSPLGGNYPATFVHECRNEVELLSCLENVLYRKVDCSDHERLFEFMNRFNWQTSARLFVECINDIK